MSGLSYQEYKRLKETSLLQPSIEQIEPIEKGGPGSGNFEHEGRPGEVGGSSPDNDESSIVGNMASMAGYVAGKAASEMGGSLTGTVAGWEIGKRVTPQAVSMIGRALGLGSQRARLLAEVSGKIPVVRDVIKYAMAGIGASIGAPSLGGISRSIFEYLYTKGINENTSPEVIARMDFSDAPEFHTKDLEKGGPGSGNFEHEGRPGKIGGSSIDDRMPEPEERSAARDISSVAGGTTGAFLGYGLGGAVDDVVGHGIAKLSPGAVNFLKATVGKIPMATKLAKLMGPGGIIGSIVMGDLVGKGVEVLFDYLEGKGIKSPQELMHVDEDELLDAPTYEDLKRMFNMEQKQKKMRESLSYRDYCLLRENDSHSPGDYLVREDPKLSSTWHLPVRRNGTPDHQLMAAARAALTSNFRGHAYSGPNSGGALSELKSLYKSEGMKWDDNESNSD